MSSGNISGTANNHRSDSCWHTS